MVKYLFVIFYLCIVMFLKLGHQLAKGEPCGIAPDKAAYCVYIRNLVDLKTQLNSFLCVQKRNKILDTKFQTFS